MTKLRFSDYVGTRFAIGLLEVAKEEFGLAQHWNTVKRPGVWSVA